MQELYNEEYQKIIKELLIYGEPTSNLKDCLGFYTKQKLTDIAEHYGMQNIASKKKDEIIDALSNQMIESLPSSLLYEDPEEISNLIKFCTNKAKVDDIRMISNLIKYRYLGWVYLFTAKEDDKLMVIIPEEIKVCILEFLGDKDRRKEASLNKVILQYLKVLNNLYGVFEMEQLIKVWNKYHDEKLEAAQLDGFLSNMKLQYDFFWRDENYIINGLFDNKEEYQGLLTQVKNKPYYMPTKEDLVKYENELVDVNSKYYKALKTYLSMKTIDSVSLDNLLFEMETVCILDAPPSEVINLVNEYGVVFFDENDSNSFLKLYIDWHNNTRLWATRGFVANEVSSVVKNDPFVLAGTPQGDKKKIGRNDPCPCGSGKKYKHCCGR